MYGAMNTKNITRYNGGSEPGKGFCGWRLCITRSKEVFVRYFTDREFGGQDPALEAALNMREEILAALATAEASPVEVFARYRKNKVVARSARRRRRKRRAAAKAK